MNKIVFGILIIAIISGVGLFILSNQKDKTLPLPLSEPSPTVSQTDNFQRDLEAGGSSYLDEKGVYSLLYPNDYTLDTNDPNHIRIFKRAVTERPQSEISDGVIMVFESIDLGNSSLESLVDTRIKESTSDGTSKVIEAKKPIVQNAYPGFSYTLRGLGISKNIVIQKDNNSNYALLITYSISDPQGKDYQKEVDAVLSLIKLLK